jgi:hypothetical protein
MTSSFSKSRNGNLFTDNKQPNAMQRNTDPIPLTSIRNPANMGATPVRSTVDNHFSFDETMLADDLSTMPVIDDRTLSMALKTKYESKKIYVS